MKPTLGIFFAATLFFLSCGKKEKHPEEEPTVVAEAQAPESASVCQDLPPAPVPFGWQDTVTDPNKEIIAFLIDPLDPDKIIYVVNGDFGNNKLFFYNVLSKQTKFISTLGEFLPQVNQKGWITFSDVDNTIFLIKSDSLIQLTYDHHSKDPKWDVTGNYIYYYKEEYSTYPSHLFKIDLNGNIKVDILIPLPYSASFKKSDSLLVLEVKNNICNIVLKDPDDANTDRILISGPIYSKPGQINFDNLTLDNKDEFFYWSNSNGIFRCNLATLKIDTLLKNCQNSIYNNPIVSFRDNGLTYSHHIITPVSAFKLAHQYKAMEMNLNTMQSIELRIFP